MADRTVFRGDRYEVRTIPKFTLLSEDYENNRPFNPNNEDGRAEPEDIVLPSGITVDSTGNLYTANPSAHVIDKMLPSGEVRRIAGRFNASGLQDGVKRDARFNVPCGITIDSKGVLYVADTLNHSIRQILEDGTVATIAGTRRPGYDDGPGRIAYFNTPTGIAINKEGILFIVDQHNHAIRKIDLDGQVSTFAGGEIGFSDGKGTDAKFTYPFGITIDKTGTLYVTDSGNHTIRRILTDGTVTTVAGKPRTSGSADGTGRNARFGQPTGIAVDAMLNLYITDVKNNNIRKISRNKGYRLVTTMNGFTKSKSTSTFNKPFGITIDGAGVLYIADTSNGLIKKMKIYEDPANIVMTKQLIRSPLLAGKELPENIVAMIGSYAGVAPKRTIGPRETRVKSKEASFPKVITEVIIRDVLEEEGEESETLVHTGTCPACGAELSSSNPGFGDMWGEHKGEYEKIPLFRCYTCIIRDEHLETGGLYRDLLESGYLLESGDNPELIKHLLRKVCIWRNASDRQAFNFLVQSARNTDLSRKFFWDATAREIVMPNRRRDYPDLPNNWNYAVYGDPENNGQFLYRHREGGARRTARHRHTASKGHRRTYKH